MAETVLPNPRATPGMGRSLPGANAWLSRLIGFQVMLLAFAIAGSWSSARHSRVVPEADPVNEVPVVDFPVEQAGSEPLSPNVPSPDDLPADAPADPIVPEVVPELAMEEVVAPTELLTLLEALPLPPESVRPAPDVPREPPPRTSATGPSTAARPPARPVPTTGSTAGTGGVGAPVLFGAAGTGRFPLPPYPSEARRRGLEGKVMLLVEVSAQGQPGLPRIESSSGHASLDRAAVDWIRRRWRWEAGPLRYFRIPINYQLQ